MFSAELQSQLRRQMRAEMTPIFPAEVIDEVIDLAIHSASEGLRAATEVTARASTREIRIAAFAPAFSLLASFASAKLEEVAREAKASGMHTKISDFVVGPGQ